jgi:hypothetical protein
MLAQRAPRAAVFYPHLTAELETELSAFRHADGGFGAKSRWEKILAAGWLLLNEPALYPSNNSKAHP